MYIEDFMNIKNITSIKEQDNSDDVRLDHNGDDNADLQRVQDTIYQYQDKSENELMDYLEQALRDGRLDGTFSDEMLDIYIMSVKPMMNTSQLNKLVSLCNTIKAK